MARIDVLEGGVECTLKGNDVQVIRVGESGKTLPGDYTNLNRDQLLQIYNKLICSVDPRYGKILKSFKNKATAMDRTRKTVDTYLLMREDIPKDEVAEVEGTKAARKGGKRATYADDQVIRVLTDANPKRENTAAYAKYGFFRDGMTVGEYRAVEGDCGGADQGWPRGWPNGEIRWCVNKGFIRVEDAT